MGREGGREAGGERNGEMARQSHRRVPERLSPCPPVRVAARPQNAPPARYDRAKPMVRNPLAAARLKAPACHHEYRALHAAPSYWHDHSRSKGSAMTLISRLETISSSLSQMFEQGSEVQQRKAVRAACSKAVSDVNLTGNEIEMALQLIASGVGDPDLHDKLNAIAGEFDEKYFDLTDDADTTQEL